MNDKKVLTLSISCWNNRSGAETISSLFENCNPNNIANIYFKDDLPNSNSANHYFHICEKRIFKSIFRRKIIIGENVLPENCSSTHFVSIEEAKQKKFYSFWSRHRFWSLMIFREILWKLGAWKSNQLIKFIDDFKPDIVFFPIEGYIYFNRIILWILKKWNIKAYAYLWDDNISYKQHKFNICYLIHRKFLNLKIKKILPLCDNIFAISEKTKRELDFKYCVNSVLLTKPCKLLCECNDKHLNRPIKIVYTGRLNLNRDKTIKTLVSALDILNKQTINFILEIYSQTSVPKHWVNSITREYVLFKGPVTSDKISDIQKSSDMLLLVEALKGRDKFVSRLSFSTKTTDYLGTGKIILCMCPKDNATYEYLNKNNAAICADNKHDLIKLLSNSLSNPSQFIEYSTNSLKLAEKYHLKENVINIFEKTLKL